jgi:hypothetical protein
MRWTRWRQTSEEDHRAWTSSRYCPHGGGGRDCSRRSGSPTGTRRSVPSASAYGQQVQRAAPAAAPATAAAQDDVITRLQQLAQLEVQGILTDEELAAKEARILGG